MNAPPYSDMGVSEAQSGPIVENVARKTTAALVGRAVVLCIATIAVLLAITAAADIRRHQQAMDQARWHAGELATRLGANRLLPLNLEPADVAERSTPAVAIESLAAGQVLALRQRRGAVIAAQTVPQHMRLAPDGRAVVLFEDGTFRVEWMTLDRFDDQMREQLVPDTRLPESAASVTPP
jgi:hypothetical protein